MLVPILMAGVAWWVIRELRKQRRREQQRDAWKAAHPDLPRAQVAPASPGLPPEAEP